MKIVKVKTLNEAIAELGDKNYGVMDHTLADALKDEKENKKKAADMMVEVGKTIPMEDRDAHTKGVKTPELKKMHLAESLFEDWDEDDDEEDEIDSLYHDASEEELRKIGAFDNLNDDEELDEALNLDQYGKAVKNAIKKLVLDSDEELRDFVNKIIDEIIEERNSDKSLNEAINGNTSHADEFISALRSAGFGDGFDQKLKIDTYGNGGTRIEFKDQGGTFIVTITDDKVVLEGQDEGEEPFKNEYTEWPKFVTEFNDLYPGIPVGEDLEDCQRYPVEGTKQVDLTLNESNNDPWESKDPSLLIKVYEEYPDDNSSKDKKIREMLQILIDNNIKYSGNNTRNNDIVNIVRTLATIPNPEIDINKITSIRRTVYPKFADDYDLFGWFADTGDEFYVISMNGKNHLVLISDDGVNIFTPEKANQFVDNMIKTGYMEEDDPDIPEIRNKFIRYAKRYGGSNALTEASYTRSDDKIMLVKPNRDPLVDVIQMALTDGEWGYVKSPDGTITPSLLPHLSYDGTKDVGVAFDKDGRYFIRVWDSSEENLQKVIDVANQFNREYKVGLDKYADGDKKWYCLIYLNEDTDFDDPYVDPEAEVNTEGIKGRGTSLRGNPNARHARDNEDLEDSQRYPIESPAPAQTGLALMEESNINEDVQMNGSLMEDKISVDMIHDFKPEEGAAEETFNRILEAGKMETFEFALEDRFPNGVTTEELNKILREESQWVYNHLGMKEYITPDSDEEEL